MLTIFIFKKIAIVKDFQIYKFVSIFIYKKKQTLDKQGGKVCGESTDFLTTKMKDKYFSMCLGRCQDPRGTPRLSSSFRRPSSSLSLSLSLSLCFCA